jgi:hypothetical protein
MRKVPPLFFLALAAVAVHGITPDKHSVREKGNRNAVSNVGSSESSKNSRAQNTSALLQVATEDGNADHHKSHNGNAAHAKSAAAAASSRQRSCPCDDVDGCAVIEQHPIKEIFGFGADNQAWKHYPFDVITTIAWPPGLQASPGEDAEGTLNFTVTLSETSLSSESRSIRNPNRNSNFTMHIII